MPHPDEPYYCSQQINIPPELPDILKQFTKAAIRTQPKDVLAWSAAYFRAMANGEMPPVKDRLETPVATQKTDTGLTPGLLRVLNKQLGPRRVVALQVVEEKWKDLALPKEQFDELVRIGSFAGDVEWLKFFALTCSTLGEQMLDTYMYIIDIVPRIWTISFARTKYHKTKRFPRSITDAMKTVCEILTADPDGGPARIPFQLFQDLYRYLAQIDGEITQEHINDVISHLTYEVEKQDGMVQPRNFLNADCPSLA